MPIPIILGAVAAGTAIYGAYKGVSGAIDHSNASDINDDAQSVVNTANQKVEEQRKATYDTLEDLHDYGARVAGSVGAMMCWIMGVRSAQALARACELAWQCS